MARAAHTVARQSRIRTGFPRPLDVFNLCAARGGSANGSGRISDRLRAQPNPRIGGQGSPVKDRRGPATVTEEARRTPRGSHWPRGREGATGKLGSQETSLRSLHQALEERGPRMQSSFVSMPVRALRGGSMSRWRLPGRRRGHGDPGEIDAGDRQSGGVRARPAGSGDRGTLRLRTRLLQQRLGGDLAGRRGCQRRRRRAAPAAPRCRTSSSATTAQISGPAAKPGPSPPSPTTSAATLVAHAAGTRPGAALAPAPNLPAQIAERWNPAAAELRRPGNDQHGLRGPGAEGHRRSGLGPLTRRLATCARASTTMAAGPTRPRRPPVAKAEPSEPDMTGAAIAALCEAGAPAYDPSVAPALAYLQGLLVDATGAIHYAFGDNADATAWAVSGLTACGVDPQSAAWTTPSGKTPIDHLLSLQAPRGPKPGASATSTRAKPTSTRPRTRCGRSRAGSSPRSRRRGGSVAAKRPPARQCRREPRSPHLLAIELAPGNVRMCKVTAPAGAPLSQVLARGRGRRSSARGLRDLVRHAGGRLSLARRRLRPPRRRGVAAAARPWRRDTRGEQPVRLRRA